MDQTHDQLSTTRVVCYQSAMKYGNQKILIKEPMTKPQIVQPNSMATKPKKQE
uniref:Uncharacterized protein n=1 Tax=Tetranychus urticae TaxID=32264 RepID=T1KLH1_TETUR